MMRARVLRAPEIATVGGVIAVATIDPPRRQWRLAAAVAGVSRAYERVANGRAGPRWYSERARRKRTHPDAFRRRF